MAWSTAKGFNFRATAGFVTDGADETGVLESVTYPSVVSIGGENVTLGWETSPTSGNSRNRTAGAPNAPRLSGIQQCTFGDPGTEWVFRVDLPAIGTYTIRLAAGDQSGGNKAFWEIRDTTSVVLSEAETTTAGDEYCDAAGVLRTGAAAWIANNASVDQAFATTIFRFALKEPTTSNSSVIAHLQLTQVAPPEDNTIGMQIEVRRSKGVVN